MLLEKKVLNNDKNDILQQRNEFEMLETMFYAEILDGEYKTRALEEIGVGIKTVGEQTVLRTTMDLDFKQKDSIEVVGITTGLIQPTSKPIINYTRGARRLNKNITWILIIS